MGYPKAGQPTKYKAEFCELLIEHMRQGLSFESFAGTAMVSRDSLYEWLKRHPEFSYAKKIGQDLGLKTLEQLGMALAAGKLQGSNSAWIFIMKNRAGWRDKQEIEHVGKDGGPISVTSLSDEELDRRIEALEKRRTT